ncbi:MAG TPA: hypothetical protein VFB43_06430 [Terracidiphilus sp.]|jgi:hypothetical protein|nr:hypothetical protein [Terracidiphilus sp.]
MESQSAAMPTSEPSREAENRGILPVLKSYFYWTYTRGSFHYDVMVTLILLFIFVTPHLWNFGDRPSTLPGPQHPIQVSGDGGRGLILTVQAVDVAAAPGAPEAEVKKALRQAIQPVTGDAVSVEHWETVTDAQGNVAWKVWAHK